jgi:hypothetical protein
MHSSGKHRMLCQNSQHLRKEMPKKVRSIRLVFSADEHRRVRLAAAMVDQSVTAFARTTVLSAADLDRDSIPALVSRDPSPVLNGVQDFQYPRNDPDWPASGPSVTDISTPRQ